ncbi:Hint domain-containing protein [Monaibacterium marinum]|uniref:Hint domain-containing protein n=1 Tax=Pontivivens marinum TaxID=1690039 RepID=A0A2C9CQ26_9RHOB|nr:Hint domain-containing protein [Monaibacterium marinum]SOH93362.1 Hint domain-containing protein [Monaibacterium marinum]
MANFVITANSFGSFYQNVGNNGTDDTVTVNIGIGFSGAITVDSQPADGEIESTIVNIPDGWSLQVDNLVEDAGYEDPSFKEWSYQVFNTNGDPVGTLSIRNNNVSGVPCFCRGVKIETERGLVAIEDLGVGDKVLTLDNGYRPIRWIGNRKLDSIDLAINPKLRPVRITAGALGRNMPEQNLMVSPQHRVLIRSKIALRMFNTSEVLIPAIKLCSMDGIEQVMNVSEVDYWHMLFDDHEIVYSNGAATESLFVGPEALKAVSTESRDEIIALFPEIATPTYAARPARFISKKGRCVKQLVARHLKNKKKLFAEVV